MKIENKVDQIPVDSSARISSAGLLGDNYVSILPGYSEKSLKSGGAIRTTYSATSIENLSTPPMRTGDRTFKLPILLKSADIL